MEKKIIQPRNTGNEAFSQIAMLAEVTFASGQCLQVEGYFLQCREKEGSHRSENNNPKSYFEPTLASFKTAVFPSPICILMVCFTEID